MNKIREIGSAPQDYRTTVAYLQELEFLQAKFSHYAVTYSHQSLFDVWLTIDSVLSSSDRLYVHIL